MTTPIRIQAPLDLDQIAACLEGLEETIITKLIDRAQFALNQVVYQPGKSGFEGEERSLFEIRLHAQEVFDSEFGRFCVPEERPFTKGLPASKRNLELPPSPLSIDDCEAVNMTEEILTGYRDLLPAICLPGDDGHYGSSVEHDAYALQAIARRVHFGALYVGESKYESDPEVYDTLIEQRDTVRLLQVLTRPEVEDTILERVASKVEHLQAEVNPQVRRRIASQAVLGFYQTHIIPLTKEGEIRYFLSRRREPK